jgi:hypothetical protein
MRASSSHHAVNSMHHLLTSITLTSARMTCANLNNPTEMGKEAGYLPPVQSIKAQVMNGTLLASSRFPPRLDWMGSLESGCPIALSDVVCLLDSSVWQTLLGAGNHQRPTTPIRTMRTKNFGVGLSDLAHYFGGGDGRRTQEQTRCVSINKAGQQGQTGGNWSSGRGRAEAPVEKFVSRGCVVHSQSSPSSALAGVLA